MKPTFLFLSLFSIISLKASAWKSDYFSEFQPVDKSVIRASTFLKKGTYPFQFFDGDNCFQPESAMKLNQAMALVACTDPSPSTRLFRDGQYVAQIITSDGVPSLTLSVEAMKSNDDFGAVCPVWDHKSVEIDVSKVFKDGETVRDAYSGQSAVVKDGKINLLPSSEANGLLLLESDTQTDKSAVFDWKNATVYFALTDRFYNGDPSNDNSYGRHKDGMEEIGTFHGGDLKGLTEKLDYLQQLGVDAIWISSPLEQIHGWVGGGDRGDFPHYAYHGYYHLDWTKVDANMGTEDDLKTFIEQAHQRGIRVLFDIVMNHTGYATLADMQEFGFGRLRLKPDEMDSILGEHWTDWTPKKGQNWHSFNDFINFSDQDGWSKWWGKAWARSDIGDYDSPKFDDLKMSLSALPDIKTESDQAVTLPEFFANKPDTKAVSKEDTKVREYLISWLSDWVKKYGLDGFRVDTAKHVEQSTWLELKQSAQAALNEWKATHPDHFNDDFWMTGEAWGHGVYQSDYFKNGFDSMINFSFQDPAKEALSCFGKIVPTYQTMSEKIADLNVLSYISSHDTRLFFNSDSENDIEKQKVAGSLLLLAPGAVQIYYGDESGRKFGATGSDPLQGTRSDMNWSEIENNPETQSLITHWTKLAKFRQNHIAVGKGKQTILETKKYLAFSREEGNDKVMVVWAGK
ncbi:alpha-amylase [Otariodibacter oris]|uniref:Alpha-amylase n=1 Tax=Otariodibacter oris TaxID=1032623 RepID=A0A420XH90_9PAST|nr:alpha-amylase [Otariodibacter oris]QGM81159.1 DUF5116 domain-containing protein [Otariodibacter oris]RKR72712.1 alpha-amylase [Otariodibacter oris]